MRAAIDRSGRVVVPKSIRDRLGLEGGEELEIEERDGVIEIRPRLAAIEIVDTADGPVARIRGSGNTIDDSTVLDTLESIRR